MLKPKTLCWISLAFIFPLWAGAQSININASDYQQTIDMMGGDMERSANAIQNAKNKAEIVDWAFGDIEFNTCRVQFDKNQELTEGNKNWDFYTKQIASMNMVKASNPNIKFFASLRTDYDGYGDNNNLPDWFCNYTTKAINTDKFGVFLADYVEYMSQQGLPIAYLSIVKEWASYVPAEVAKEVIVKLNSELEARHIEKPLIIDQGFWSLSKGISYLNTIGNLGTKDLYHAFCSHNYQNEDETKWNALVNAATNLGKPAYNDETGGGYGGPSWGEEPDITKPLDAYAEKCGTYRAGLKGEIFFEVWSRGINKETRAIYCPWGGTGTRMRGYYIMKLFANNILNSKYVTSTLSSMPDVYTMAFRRDDKLAVWIINKSTSDYSSVPISITHGTINGEVTKTFWTSSTPITGSTEGLSAPANLLQTDIAAESLNCLLVNLETTTSINEEVNDDLLVFPTLVKDGWLNIHPDFQASRIQILDIKGRKARESGLFTSEMNVSGLNPGMYMVLLTMPNKQLTQKIIIE